MRLYIGDKIHHTHQVMSGRGSSLLLHKGGAGAASSYDNLEQYSHDVETPTAYSKHLPIRSHNKKPSLGGFPQKKRVIGGTLSSYVNKIRQGAPEEREQDKALRNLTEKIGQLQLNSMKDKKPKAIRF